MIPLCEKYRALCFADIKGQDDAADKIKAFMKNFPNEKALIIHGPTGTGKTSLVYAIAQETSAEILEINASDLRDRESISNIVGQASQQSSLFAKNKILLVDEIDGITHDDRGGLPELIGLIETSSFPIIMTANDIWDKKFSDLRKKAEMVEVKELKYNTIFEILKNLAAKENLKFPDDLLKSIAIKSRGDMRAAINDLQTIGTETLIDDIPERDKEEKIFNVLRQIFKFLPNENTLLLLDKLNMSLDEVLLWIEENIPKEYKGEELAKAYDALAKADVFRGRIHRQQHWRFLVYENFLLSAGISASKTKAKTGFTPYQRPGRILKIWIINQKQKYKKSISEKYALLCHISVKRAKQDFGIIKKILQNKPETQKKLKLTEEEVEFLQN